jgi:glycosyltransferase involved in cell wall biosynthesis
LAAVGDAIIGAQIQRACRRLFDSPPVLLVCSPARGALPRVARRLLVYWQRDRLAESEGARRPAHIARRHRELLDAAGLVTGVSPELVTDARRHLGTRSTPVALIPNGGDYEHFAKRRPRPAALPDAGPVVGFAGGLSWRVDAGLLAAVARDRPDWTVVVVGEGGLELATLPNLLAFGRQPYDELPAWVQAFDVGLVPYVVDRFNAASFPLKVFEYLAAGVPVVSTPLPALEGLAPHVRLADAAHFAGAIDEALSQGPSAAACQAIAKANSWDERADQLEAAIADALARAA